MPQAANASSCNNNFLLGPASPTVRISAATVGSIHESPANLDARSDILRRDRRPRLSAPSVTRSDVFCRVRRPRRTVLQQQFLGTGIMQGGLSRTSAPTTDGWRIRGQSRTPVPTRRHCYRTGVGEGISVLLCRKRNEVITIHLIRCGKTPPPHSPRLP